MARQTSSPAQPRFVRHAKRPEWGVGRVVDLYAGLTRVQFADGDARGFRTDVLEPVAADDVPPEMLNAPEPTASVAPVRPAVRKTRKAPAKAKV